MANKKTRVTYGGINQDVAKSRVQDNMYYDAKNIKLTPVEGQTFGALSNAYGNTLALSLPRPWVDKATSSIRYGDKSLPYTSREIDSIKQTSGKQTIIGDVSTTNGALLFSTDGTLDCIWEIEDITVDDLNLTLLYMREMGFNVNNPIQAIFNYENKLIQKVYWVDGGLNYLRFINIRQSIDNGYDKNLIDIPVTSVNSKSTIDVSKPRVEDGGGGGIHTAGMIQYAYTLYNLNGAETSLSPISPLFPLDKGIGNGGGDVNEVVGSMPVVVIENLDKKYTYIKLYSVKYTEYNGVPEIKLIYDGNIGNYTRFTYNDTGTSNLGNLDLASFLFLGADPIKPSHITSKDNYLFAANNVSTAYKLDVDMRAYSFNAPGTKAEIFNDVIYDKSKGEIPYTGIKWDVATQGYNVPKDFDCVNLDFDTFRYVDSGQTAIPGRVILDNAVLIGSIVAAGPVDKFSGKDGVAVATMVSTCDPTNTAPKVYDIELIPINGTNNRIIATEDSMFEVEFSGDISYNDPTNRLIVSSTDAYVQIYPNATSNTLVREEKMIESQINGVNFFRVNVSLLTGQAVRVIYRVRSHYNNDTCQYQCSDSFSAGGYEGDGPYIGPNENGLTSGAQAELLYNSFRISTVSTLSRITPLGLTPTNGEPNVINDKYVADFTGSMSSRLDVTVNLNGKPLVDTLQYSLVLLRNGVIVNSSQLVLTGPTTHVFTFTPTISVTAGDQISLALRNNRPDINGNTTLDPLADGDIDLTISGELDLSELSSAGSNGEGGSGKFINYFLERTEQADLGMSLREARFFKDNEIYRIAIVFWNSIGQASEAKWIADFKAPQGNLEGQFNTLKVSFTQAFYDYITTLPEETRPTNYTVVRALRTSTDKTIISQGIMSGMFVQDYTSNFDSTKTDAQKAGKNPGLVKTPIPITRGYGNGVTKTNTYYPVFPTRHNRTMNESHSQVDPSRPSGDQDPKDQNPPRDIIVDEIYRDSTSDFKRQQSWQYTKMMQMYSPEATFGFQISTTDKDQLHVLGYMPRNEYNIWDFNIDTETFGPQLSWRKDFTKAEQVTFFPHLMGGFGVIGPSYRRWESGQGRVLYADYETKKPAKHARRTHFRKTFLPLERASNPIIHDILNRPEVTEVGQGITSYNSDKSLQYTNKLSLVVSDEKKATNDDSLLSSGGSSAAAIKAVQSENNRCLTIVLGDNNMNHEDRPGLEDLYGAINTGEWDVELFGEVRKSKSYVYSGALYGGYDVSSRSRTEYISIGDAYDINQSVASIKSPGDTYVQTFKNTRLTKIPGTVYTNDVQCIVETLEYLVETSVNLEERNDSSIISWDSTVDPTAEEGTSYNKVYSTDSTIRRYTTDSLKIRDIERKEVQIIASKPKVPGEFVDNWVDFQPNEVQYLDGKYGPINNIVNHWDRVFAFQDFAVAAIAVNPRVQIQDSDNVSIQLGTGRVLHDYQYISTKSGSINKWGMVSANSGLYYLDANLKQIQRIQPGQGIEAVSEAKGLHGFLQRNLTRDQLAIDNPVTGNGAVMGYDIVNGDVYTTIVNGDDSFTVSFNEKMNSFTSFYDFIPNRYIVKGDKVVTVPNDNNSLWAHTKESPYQTWYGSKNEASITLIINTDVPGIEKVFNNIEFDSEVTLDGVDISSSTIDSIEGWTTYQNSGKIPLVVGANLQRKFRTWRTFIPRHSNSRQRLRDKWLFLKLGFNPDDNKKLILHDIIINYSI